MNERLGREARELIDRARREEAVADADELARIRRRVVVAASGTAIFGTLGKALALKSNIPVGIQSLLKAALIGSSTGAVAIGFTLMITTPSGSSNGARESAPAARAPARSVAAVHGAPPEKLEELQPSAAPTSELPAPRASIGVRPSPPRGSKVRAPHEAAETRSPSLTNAAAQNVAARSVAAQTPPDATTLAPELALLERVQAELRSGHGARALELLDNSDRSVEKSQLRAERLAAEVFAACQAGDRERARRVMQRFLDDYPNTPTAARVRASCAGAESVE